MKIYLVWGLEWQIGKYLYGVYESPGKASIRLNTLKLQEFGYDDYEVEEIELNTDMNDV